MTKKQDLYIIGAGSVGGHLAVNLYGYSDAYKLKGFVDDDESKWETAYCGYPVIGGIRRLKEMKNTALAVGIAIPRLKEQVLQKLDTASYDFPAFVHERAWISEDVKVGQGTIIYPGTCINYGSAIGDFVVCNLNCALGHHTSLGSFTSLAPGVNTGGHTRIEEGVEMGIGASTLQHMIVKSGAVVGGQSMVTEYVPEGVTVAGVPAKVIRDQQ